VSTGLVVVRPCQLLPNARIIVTFSEPSKATHERIETYDARTLAATNLIQFDDRQPSIAVKFPCFVTTFFLNNERTAIKA
jgi:hypothetical protein